MKLRFFIPTIGTRLVLAKDWTFTLYDENRNRSLIKLSDYTRPERQGYAYRNTVHGSTIFTLPEGTVMVVDRIYIRQNNGDYDSITFKIGNCSIQQYVKARFWVKLNDANKIECEVSDVFFE